MSNKRFKWYKRSGCDKKMKKKRMIALFCTCNSNDFYKENTDDKTESILTCGKCKTRYRVKAENLIINDNSPKANHLQLGLLAPIRSGVALIDTE